MAVTGDKPGRAHVISLKTIVETVLQSVHGSSETVATNFIVSIRHSASEFFH